MKAKEKQKKHEFTKFCHQQCDEIFEIFLEKFTQSHNRSLPKPLVMGPNSRNLYDSIRTQFMELIGLPPTPADDGSVDTVETYETVDTLSYFIMEFVKNAYVDALKMERK